MTNDDLAQTLDAVANRLHVIAGLTTELLSLRMLNARPERMISYSNCAIPLADAARRMLRVCQSISPPTLHTFATHLTVIESGCTS